MTKSIVIAVTLLLLISLSVVQAQKFGVRSGINLPSMRYMDETAIYSDDNKIKLGFHLGGLVNYSITGDLSVEGSVLLSLKGVRRVERSAGIKHIYNENLYYLDIPVAVKYTFKLKGLPLFGMAGIYHGIGLSGRKNHIVKADGEKDTETRRVEWGHGKQNDYKVIDWGLNIGAGMIRDNIQLGLFYELGLINISSNTDYGRTIKNRTFGLTVVYFFEKGLSGN